MQCEDNPPAERAHHPRPFGCGLRACPELAEGVTVKSVRTRTVVDPGGIFSFFVTVVAIITSDCEPVDRLRTGSVEGSRGHEILRT